MLVQLAGAILAGMVTIWAAPPLPDGAMIEPLDLQIVPRQQDGASIEDVF